MGHPKKQRKKYEAPLRPYDKQRIERERKILNDYGLRRKRELWKAESILRDFRRRARELLAARDEKKQAELLGKLNKIGIEAQTLDDVLSVRLENILSRRLQTILYKKGVANTPKHARQLIVHGHVLVNEQRILWPSYIVQRSEEDRIALKDSTAKSMAEAERVALKK
jgi:small subunit ribosomal protein S4